MKVLVTGAGGFLGTAIVKKLLSAGHQVSGFARSKYAHLNELGALSVQGDLKNYGQVAAALEGHDACLHAAGKVAMWGDWSDFYNTNVVGTENVIKACRELAIKKLVYTSSPSVVFGQDDLLGVDESCPYPERHLGMYGRSKRMAEEKVLAADGVQGLNTVALRPHLIWGPGDQNLIPRMVIAAKKGRIKIIGDGQNLVDVVYVDNAADAHLLALEKLGPGSPICGKAYFLGQGPVKLWSFINQLLELYELPPIKKKISFKTAYRLGALTEKMLDLFRIHNVDPFMTRFVALQLAKSHYFDHKNARQDLGWIPKVSLDEGLANLRESLH